MQTAVNDFRLVLRLDAGEVFLFRLGNSQAVVGFANVFGDVAPVALLTLRRANEIENVLKVEVAEIPAPVGHRLLEERGERIEPELGHPGRLTFHFGNLAHDLFIETLAALEDILIGRIMEAVLIIADSHIVLEIGGHLLNSQATQRPNLTTAVTVGFSRSISIFNQDAAFN